jgi:hypothetical protein
MHTLALLLLVWTVVIPTGIVAMASLAARRRERRSAPADQPSVTVLTVAARPPRRKRAPDSCALRPRPVLQHGLAPRR